MTLPHHTAASRLLGAFLSALLLSQGFSATQPGKNKPEEKPATIYVIRGGGGYFPNLGTVINQKFRDQGLNVIDYRFHERESAAKSIANSLRSGELPHGVILIGYSLGGCGAIDVSRSLQKENIPVRLLFLIETINPLQTVPANVQECFNLFHFPAFLGSPVRADSPSTKLTNFEAYTDGGLGLEYSHFTMPFVAKVHELIALRLINAIHSKPPTESPASALSSTAPGKAESPASQPVAAPVTAKKKRQPLFPGRFPKFHSRSAAAPATPTAPAASEAAAPVQIAGQP